MHALCDLCGTAGDNGKEDRPHSKGSSTGRPILKSNKVCEYIYRHDRDTAEVDALGLPGSSGEGDF